MSEATPASSSPSGASGAAAEAADAGPLHPRPSDPTPPRRPRRGGDLPARLLTAAVLIPLVLYLIYLGGLPYLVAVIAIIVLGQREFYGMIEGKGARPSVGFGLGAGAALPVVTYLGEPYHATILMTVTLLAVMVLQLGKARITEAMASISGTFFGVFYVGWLLSHAVALRFVYDAVLARSGVEAVELTGLVPDAGIFFMVYTLAVVVFCDAGAYFAGRAYGRRKLAPNISPGKTVEGAIGGVVAGFLGGYVTKGVCDLFWPELSHSLSWLAALLLGLVLSAAAIVGDLTESLLKRDAERKDAGWILPGMGGVLDRIDSVLLAIPVMYYTFLFYVFLQVG